MHMLIAPNQWVREGTKFSDGTDCGPMLDLMMPENLLFLEDLLDDGPGICRVSIVLRVASDIVTPLVNRCRARSRLKKESQATTGPFVLKFA